MSLNVISANSESTKIKNKIPEYAKDFRKEWLYIRGINKKCSNFIGELIFSRKDMFNYPLANNLKFIIKKFLKDQERGKLKDISGFYFEYCDTSSIEVLEEQLGEYSDLYVDPNSLEFDEEHFNLFIDSHYPGYKEFLELISLINDKVKKKDPIFKNNIDSDSDSDSDSD